MYEIFIYLVGFANLFEQIHDEGLKEYKKPKLFNVIPDDGKNNLFEVY